MTRDQIRAALTDQAALVATLMGEAAGEPLEGQIAIATVIRNRAARPGWWGGPSLASVCVAPHQFSCWSDPGADGDRTYQTAEAVLAGAPLDPLTRELAWIADGVRTGALRDHLDGATHYLTAALFRTAAPAWTHTAHYVAQIGAHVFLQA